MFFPLPIARRRISGTPTRGLRRPLADGLRGQVTLDRPWPSCGWESVPGATLPRFPLAPAIPEAQGRRPSAADALGGLPCFPAWREEEERAYLTMAPSPFCYLLKNPSAFGLFLIKS